MAVTNHERVGKGLELLRAGLGPFVERELKQAVQAGNLSGHRRKEIADDPMFRRPSSEWDVAVVLRLIWDNWHDAFSGTLGRSDRSLVSELRDHRNKWAHQEPFSSDDAYRALDSVQRLLTSISAPQVREIDAHKQELLRVRFQEQVRGERRRTGRTVAAAGAVDGLKAWRDVVTPHQDVASGRYQQAEFAADLWQVFLGEGTDEYRDPTEFFRRTYLTASLRQMLVGAVQRLTGRGGDPVVQLQTNFGGGKTHSMLALYHLFSGAPTTSLAGIDEVLKSVDTTRLPSVRRAVLVGNRISPGNPVTKPDGTVVRTLWGELAWQLGGPEAFARVAADDEHATSPGDRVRELLVEYGPCLVLIDEWVAYARQLHEQSDLPAGSFETQFTFAQTLTESAKAVDNCLLVISLPASDSGGSPNTYADDAEVGGQRGRDALQRLRNVIGRVEAPWRPASAEESFGIVRRRLFQTFVDAAQFTARDVVARGFSDLYRTQQQEFPAECREADYEKTDQGRLSHPSRGIRPALLRLVGAGEVPAHPRRAAADGGGDSSPVGERRSQSAHPARQHCARRRARTVGADPVSRRQLDADHRKGRRRPGIAAAAHRQRPAEPGQVRRQPPRGAGDLPRFRSLYRRRPSRHRRPAGQAGLRYAG